MTDKKHKLIKRTPKKKAIGTAKNKPPIRKMSAAEKRKLRFEMMGNEFAARWSPKAIAELCENIKKFAEDACSIAGIAADCELTIDQLYGLRSDHPTVRQHLDLAGSKIARKAWKNGFQGDGFPNILQKAINHHDKPVLNSEKEEEKEQSERSESLKHKYATKMEKIKADEKIRVVRELADKIEEGNGNVLDEFDEFLKWKEAKAQRKSGK